MRAYEHRAMFVATPSRARLFAGGRRMMPRRQGSLRRHRTLSYYCAATAITNATVAFARISLFE